MKLYLYLASLFLSFTLHGNQLKPCQVVGFENLVEYAVPGIDTMTMASAKLSLQDREEKIRLLKNCVNKYAVCIVEASQKDSSWLSEKLVAPINKGFDPVDRHLLFGMLQYIDKQSGKQVCIVAMNGFFQAVPWYGSSWIIGDRTIKQYELWDAQFNSAMTPESLYKALLKSHEKAVIGNHYIKS